jgi:hypothetical protein
VKYHLLFPFIACGSRIFLFLYCTENPQNVVGLRYTEDLEHVIFFVMDYLVIHHFLESPFDVGLSSNRQTRHAGDMMHR